MNLSYINRLFGRKKRERFSNEENIKNFIRNLHKYFEEYKNREELIKTLISLFISFKSLIYDFRSNELKELNEEELNNLTNLINKFFEKFILLLKEVELIINNNNLNEGKISIDEFNNLLNNNLKELNEKEINEKELKILTEHILEIQELFNKKSGKISLYNIFQTKYNLLKEIKEQYSMIKNRKKDRLRFILDSIQILELEFPRFIFYTKKEIELINLSKSFSKELDQYLILFKKLGLVYSEKTLFNANLGLISTKLNNLGKNIYGCKGVGIIKGDEVEIRFVRSKHDRHAHLLNLILNGMPGFRIPDDEKVRSYLISLDLDTLSQVAGFEIQLELSKTEELKLVNIDYTSTILEIQEEKILNSNFRGIEETIFKRINYALLFSINNELYNNEKFEMNFINKGENKISVLIKNKNLIK